ncbi:MAG: S-DNA-T family DNA segregation ATPase FtsK/SpoIIIE, partial [Verrucomicrobiales bacterium]
MAEGTMRLYLDCAGSERTVAISIDDPDATISNLCEALSVGADGALTIDDVTYRREALLRDIPIVDGSRVTEDHGVSSKLVAQHRHWVGVISGPDAGSFRALAPSEYVAVGSGPLNDLVIENDTISAAHLLVEHQTDSIVVEDLNSRNGTWLNGSPIAEPTSVAPADVIRIGSSQLAVRPIESSDRHSAISTTTADTSGHILFNRPPRGPVPSMPEPIVLPEPREDRVAPSLAIISLLVPLVFAGAMVAVLGSWRYALFGLLSPVMILGNWFAGRQQLRKGRRRDGRAFAGALIKLELDFDRAESTERERRAALGPDLLEIRRRILLPSTRLWERRVESDDAFIGRVGVGEDQWHVRFAPASQGDTDEVRSVVSSRSTLREVQVLSDLRDGPIGFVGDQSRARAGVRSLVLQIAAHHGPADVQIVIMTTSERIDSWSWARWLPHVGAPGGRARIVASDGIEPIALLDEIERCHVGDALPAKPRVLLVVDDIELLHGRSSRTRRLLERSGAGFYGIVIGETIDQLPASIASVISVEADDGTFVITQPLAGRLASGVLDAISVTSAEDTARAMARFADPELPSRGNELPLSVGAVAVFSEPDARSIEQRWRDNSSETTLVSPVGISSTGIMSIDLVGDGPHMLVAGTTGSGKSEFLRTFVLGLACNYQPEDLAIVLIDYKGGAAFDSCARLPHVVGIVTDLDDHLVERALSSLEAELDHRERLLREALVSDLAGYRSGGSMGGALPRLVVVIDEFATLRNELPEFVSSLINIAQRGRSLGVHLVLATQRPSGAVDANIRANTNLRVALRVQDVADSRDVIDASDAAEIPRSLPGRAFVRRGSGDLTAVQVAYISGPTSEMNLPVRVADIHVGSEIGTRFVASASVEATTELDALVDTCIVASADHPTPRTPWLEQLPLPLSATDIESIEHLDAGDEGAIVLAIGDDPKQQRRVTRGWAGLDHLAVVGKRGSGVTTTLRSTIAALAGSDLGRPVWVFVVDHAAGGLTGIDTFHHVARSISGSDLSRQERLLHFLASTLESRRRLPRGEITLQPLIVVAIDGIASFADENDLAAGSSMHDLFTKICREGPGVGILFLIGARRASELPRTLRSMIRDVIVLEQSDSDAYRDLGIPPVGLPAFGPGRALFAPGAMVAQVIDWEPFVRPLRVLPFDPPPS